MYKCKNFELYELAPEMYQHVGETLWEMFDDRALKMLDVLHEKFGTMIVNDYHWDGINQFRGVRTTKYYGSATKHDRSRSQHKYGRAFDVTFKEHTSVEVRNYVVEHPDEFPYITFLEVGISWFHFDVRNCDQFKLWSPDEGFITLEDFKQRGGI